MLSFFSDIILLIIPVLNTAYTLYVATVLFLDLSKLKKGALRGLMIFSSICTPFIIIFRFTPFREEITPHAEYLSKTVFEFGWMMFASLLWLGSIALLRLHIYGGKSNAPTIRASGKIYKWTFRDFFRKNWRLLFYLGAIGLWVASYFMLSFYLEYWSDLHQSKL